MKKSLRVTIAAGLACFASGSIISLAVNKVKDAPALAYTNGDADTYYDSIGEKTGTELLNALVALNKSKRKSTVGYSGMGTSMSGSFKYTDYDPNSTISYDSNGQPYGSRCISFYSGNSMSNWNREHVWPDSHGGNKVEADIHMPRPTIPSENGSRGNSFYVEGKCSGTNGWDPAMEDFGKESYRGDSARIIFYCCIANTNLTLLDVDYHSTSRANNDNKMGKLSDMLRWNLQYSVDPREQRRNEGAEYLQGNRNPFIDHPEYACKIWGDTNAETRKICGAKPIAPTQVTVEIENTCISINGTVQATAKVNDGASSSVSWSSSNNSVATVDSTGLITGNSVGTATITATSTVDSSIKDSVEITVKEMKGITYTGTPNKLVYDAGQSFDPTGLTISAVYSDDSTVEITKDVRWEPTKLYQGLTKVTGKYGGYSITIEGLTVNQGKDGYCLVESADELSNGDKVIIVSNDNKVAAGSLSKTYLTNISTTFSSDKKSIQELGQGTLEFTINKSGENYTFSNGSGYLNCTGEKAVSIAAAPFEWELSFDSGFKMAPAGKSSNWGTLQYNASSPRFTTYKTAQKSIQLYKAGTGGSNDTIHVESVSLSETLFTLDASQSKTITATVLPADATNKEIKWTSSNEAVATVNKGTVTAIKPGTTTITAESIDGGITATCMLNVEGTESSLLSISVSGQKTEFVEGDEFKFDGKVIATFSDGSIVDVTDKAEVSVVDTSKVGKQTVTVSYYEEGVTKTATYEINIKSKDNPTPTPTPAGNGCNGSAIAGSAIMGITSLLGLSFLMIRRKKEK